jgi:hypothetical protein
MRTKGIRHIEHRSPTSKKAATNAQPIRLLFTLCRRVSSVLARRFVLAVSCIGYPDIKGMKGVPECGGVPVGMPIWGADTIPGL